MAADLDVGRSVGGARRVGLQRHVTSGGNRSSATFKDAQTFLVKRFIEVVRDDESAFVDSENRTPVLHRHKTCHGLARTGNDDVLPEVHLPQQPGEVSLRFLNADMPHDVPNLDQGDGQSQATVFREL